MFAFIRNLIGVKTDNAVQGALEALVRWDPKSATEAELRTMEQHLDALGLQVAEARASYNREKQEADDIARLSHQRMAAAEQLQSQLAAETDGARRASLEKSLETLVSMLEKMTPDVDREAKEAQEAREFLEMLEKSYADAGGKLKAARAQLAGAQRDMGRAQIQREMAERQAEAARVAAGLSSATSGLTVALKAMQDTAAKDLAAAQAAKAKAGLLRPTKPEVDDPNIVAAMAAASGKAPVPTSLSERLAALRAKG
jgi:chromosome segregation ATPase